MCGNVSLDTVVALMTALLPFLVAGATLLYKVVADHLPAAQRARVEAEVRMLVAAAEQAYARMPGSGETKKQMVKDAVKAMGLPVSPARLDALIEAAVRALPPPTPGASN